MKKKRFIFSIKNDTSDFLLNESKRLKLSRAKLIQNILIDYKNQFIQATTPQEPPAPSWKKKQSIHLKDLESIPIQALLQTYDIYHLLSFCHDFLQKDPDREYIHYLYAKLLSHVGYYSEAIETLYSIKEETVDKNLLLARIFYTKGDAKSAYRFLAKAKEIINISSCTLEEKELFIVTQAECTWLCSGPIECLRKVNCSLEHANLYSQKTRGRLYLIKAVVSMDLNDFSEAESLLTDAIAFLNASVDYEYLCRAFSYLGFLYREKGQLDMALEYIEHARELAHTYGCVMDHLVIQSHLANIYLVLGKNELSERMLNENLTLSKQIGSAKEEFFARYILMVSYIHKKDLMSAREIIEPWYRNDTWKQYRYYTDIWKGYIDSFDNYSKGISELHTSREEAEVHEKRHVFIAQYLEGCRQYVSTETKTKGYRILEKLLATAEVSTCMKNGIQHFFTQVHTVDSV